MSDQAIATEAQKDEFKEFLKERSWIPVEIEQFLSVVLTYCVDKENVYGLDPSYIGTKHARSLILSLCKIHGFYGYPTIGAQAAEPTDDSDSIQYDQEAVRKIISTVRVQNKTFEHYCEEIGEDAFWQDIHTNQTFRLENLLREPAHIFLEMVRELFKDCAENDPSEIANFHLIHLHDVNYLKPVVWAEVKRNKKNDFAVSLGVREYLRSLFLYAKLCDLRNGSDYDVIPLQDVKAWQCVDRHSNEYINNEDNNLASKYNRRKDPCTGCNIFFSRTFEQPGETQFNYFGNCAEFDLLRVSADQKLREIEGTQHWKSFKLACEKHIEAFNNLKRAVSRRRRRGLQRKQMINYFNKTRNTICKALKYKWIQSKSGYELVTKDYRPNKKVK